MRFKQRKMQELPQTLKELIKSVGLSPEIDEGAVWNCHGTPVILHKALERIADKRKIAFDPPQVIEADSVSKIAVVCVTGYLEDSRAWSIGEAAPTNNKNEYPFAMAEKRAKDRVILKLIGASGFVYSEEEADDFKTSKPNDDEPDEDPEVRKTRDFFGEVNKKIGEVNNKAKFIAWCNTDHVKNGIAHMRQHNPDLAKMAVDRIQKKMKQLKGEA